MGRRGGESAQIQSDALPQVRGGGGRREVWEEKKEESKANAVIRTKEDSERDHEAQAEAKMSGQEEHLVAIRGESYRYDAGVCSSANFHQNVNIENVMS